VNEKHCFLHVKFEVSFLSLLRKIPCPPKSDTSWGIVHPFFQKATLEKFKTFLGETKGTPRNRSISHGDGSSKLYWVNEKRICVRSGPLWQKRRLKSRGRGLQFTRTWKSMYLYFSWTLLQISHGG
jgi:hypothetical protein